MSRNASHKCTKTDICTKELGGKMVKLDPIIIQESRKEIRAGKTHPSPKIWYKSNNLTHIFIQTGVTKCGTPLDY